MEDYPTEVYTPLLENVLSRLQHVRKSATRGWTACCPAHDDRHPSLSIGLGQDGRILLKCHVGCSLEQILAAVGLTFTDLFPTPAALSRRIPFRRQVLSLLDLAEDKLLPWQLLINLGVTEEPTGGVRILYHLFDGTPAPRYRIRTARVAKEGSWWNKGDGEIVPYGLERLEEARKDGYLILTEGETDAWTLWFHRFPALGIPGAEMTRTLKQEYLEGIGRLYVIKEPDVAGTAFVEGIASLLHKWQWHEIAYAVSLPNAKDPNELHKQDWKQFKASFQEALDDAELLFGAPETALSDHATSLENSVVFTLLGLLSKDVTSTRWAVYGLLPEGVLMLGGKPKQGKSWLVLSLALEVAAGNMVFGKYQATQGEVLYLALEDTEQRLQARTRRLLTSMTSVPSGISFATEWPRLDQGGLTQLETYLKAHPQLRLVVVDTWAKVSPRTKGEARSQYEHDYSALTSLKNVADTYHITILLVHHLRKTRAEDPLDEIAGSTGIAGAVDGVLLLKRAHGENQATLLITGRDIEEQCLSLTFDSSTTVWQLDNAAEL